MEQISFDRSLKVKDVLDDIIQQYKKNSKYISVIKENEVAIYEKLNFLESKYLTFAEYNKLNRLQGRKDIFGLDKSAMNYLFDNKYNKDIFIPVLDYHTCPICDGPEANTVDHVLPKGKFIQYTLTPCNLVPICDRCNKRKGEYVSKQKTKNPFHPYFDDVNFKKYLEARLVFTDSNEIRVFIGIKKKKSDETDENMISERLRYYNNYFNIYKMYKTYNAIAQREISLFIEDLSYFKNNLTDKLI